MWRPTPTQILGEILTHDMFKKYQDEAHGGEIDVKKKSVAFKAQDSKNEEDLLPMWWSRSYHCQLSKQEQEGQEK